MLHSEKIMLKYLSAVLILLLDPVRSAPAEVIAGGSADVTMPKLISFENGNIGVNFLGYRASAGLGGLLTGNAADGGLHAEAGTPFGQAAKAGLGGSVNGQGRAVGGLYADARAGGGVGAGAGLAGRTGSEGSIGSSYAGASAGGISKRTTVINPAIGLRGNFETLTGEDTVVVKEKSVEVQPQKTYVEKTVVPNYQEKTIYVPGYVEKTVRVPTITEQRVRVPAPPTYIEKEVYARPSDVNYGATIYKEVEPETTVYRKTKIRTHPHLRKHIIHEEVEPETTVYQKTKIRTRPHLRKHVWLGGADGYNGVYNGPNEAGYTGSYNSVVNVRKTANPQLFNDIFNIPISTLKAVNQLVGGIVGGTSGSVAVSKSVHANY